MQTKRVLALISEGLPVFDVAAQLRISPKTVRRHLSKALATESLFPSNLTPEKVAELRALAGEKIRYAWAKVAEALAATDPKQGIMIARLAEATAKLVEREARLFGLDQPTKIVQDMMQISYRKEEQRVVIEFDESQIAPDYSIDSGLREIGSDGIARRCQPPDLPNLLGEQHRPDHDDGASTTGVAGAT